MRIKNSGSDRKTEKLQNYLQLTTGDAPETIHGRYESYS